MAWPLWVWLSSPVKASVWAANRIATWTGTFYLFKRHRTRRSFWTWVVMINVVSWLSLWAVLRWLHGRSAT